MTKQQLPALDPKSFAAKSSVEKLISIMEMLRHKEHGCPWDLEQSIASLAPYTLEEVYEVVDAIEKEDMVELEDELGDLLFQVVFYAQIAAEEGHFNFSDVADAISHKLVRRHPHVFPEGSVEKFGAKQDISSDQVVVNWEAIKQQEREEKRSRGSISSGESTSSCLDDVPRALPALERARKLQKRAARVGFDWSEIGPVIDKLKEEIAELEEAIKEQNQENISDELGDVLFATVNLARHSAVEPEIALRSANQKFENRFRWIETALLAKGRSVKEADLEELDALWDQAKLQGL